MSQDEVDFESLDPSIREILKDSKTERCVILIGHRGNRRFASYRTSDTGDIQSFTTREATSINDISGDEAVFPIASLSKPIIAAGVCIMIDKLSKEEHPENPYRRLQGTWDKSFTTVFNDGKAFNIISLKGDPTVKQVLVHFMGPAPMNHILWAPDGAPLSSRQHFIEIISQYTANTNDETPRVRYSNANYILMALLIERVSGKSLDDFLKEYVFKPLKMCRTYLTKERLNTDPFETRVQPFTVSSDGVRHPIPFDDISFQSCITERSILGFRSCATDLGRFFEALWMAQTSKPAHHYFDMEVVRSMQSGIGSLHESEEYGYTPCGLYTSLDDQLAGSLSFNRLLLPGSKLSDYTLSSRSGKEKVEGFYIAGCSKGCASSIYFLPKSYYYVIVLTNTLGLLDSSDLISRLCLQEFLKLKPSKSGRSISTWNPRKWQVVGREERYKAFWVDLGKKIIIEAAKVVRDLEMADSISEATSIPCPNVCGENANTIEYENRATRQSLIVSGQGSERRVIIWEGLDSGKKSSGSMRFVWTGKTFRICSATAGKLPLGLSIDCFGDWSNLEFTPDNETYVNDLSWKGWSSIDHFVRKVI